MPALITLPPWQFNAHTLSSSGNCGSVTIERIGEELNPVIETTSYAFRHQVNGTCVWVENWIFRASNVFRNLDIFVGGFLHLAKSIFKKYWSTGFYFLQDRKTKMNLKKRQLFTGLRLKTDISGVSKPMSQTFPGWSPTPLKQNVPINMGPKVNRFRDIHCCVEIREMPWLTRNTLLWVMLSVRKGMQ
jgi:hypothetical protein